MFGAVWQGKGRLLADQYPLKLCSHLLQAALGFLITFNTKVKLQYMVSKISEGIEISVETFYQPDYSNPISGEYMFAYRIYHREP